MCIKFQMSDMARSTNMQSMQYLQQTWTKEGFFSWVITELWEEAIIFCAASSFHRCPASCFPFLAGKNEAFQAAFNPQEKTVKPVVLQDGNKQPVATNSRCYVENKFCMVT